MTSTNNNILKGLVLAVLSIFLILDLNLIVYMNTIRDTALNPDFYEKELDELNFYSFVKEKFIPEAFIQVTGGDKRFQTILQEAITEEWMRSQTTSLIHDFFSYINSETDEELSLKISTSEVKENLLKGIKREIGKFLPPPIAGDEKQIELYMDKVKEELDENVPDEFDLITAIEDEEAGGAEFKENLNQLREVVSYFHLAFYLLIGGAVTFIVIIILLAKEIKSILKVVGASFFISGSSLYAANFLAFQFVSEKFPPQENLPPFITKDVVLKILQDILEPINFWGIIFVIVGVVMIIGGFVVRKGEKKE